MSWFPITIGGTPVFGRKPSGVVPSHPDFGSSGSPRVRDRKDGEREERIDLENSNHDWWLEEEPEEEPFLTGTPGGG